MPVIALIPMFHIQTLLWVKSFLYFEGLNKVLAFVEQDVRFFSCGSVVWYFLDEDGSVTSIDGRGTGDASLVS